MSGDRLARLKEAMQLRNLDAVAVMPGANLRYLTGLQFHLGERLTLAFIPRDGSTPCLVLPAMEVGRAEALTQMPLQLFPWEDATGPLQALQEAAQILFHDQSVRVGVEYNVMRVMELRVLEHCVSDVNVVDAAPLMAEMRMVKDQNELAAMAEAVRIIEVALHRTLAHIKPGVTERELAHVLANEILAAGGDGESFPTIVASGPHSARPHHVNTDRTLEVGDLIILDAGARYAGYVSDITRTVALGEPGSEARRIYDLVLQANAAGRKVLRPGMSGEQIDQEVRRVIADNGYGGYFLHRTGHGLGLECHESPNIVAGSTHPLPAGTTFTIEPGIYIENVGGVRIEDDVVITEEGGRSLTSFERDLQVLPV